MTIFEMICEKEARLEVVEDILSIETHPAERKRYQSERSRLKARIADLYYKARKEGNQ